MANAAGHLGEELSKISVDFWLCLRLHVLPMYEWVSSWCSGFLYSPVTRLGGLILLMYCDKGTSETPRTHQGNWANNHKGEHKSSHFDFQGFKHKSLTHIAMEQTPVCSISLCTWMYRVCVCVQCLVCSFTEGVVEKNLLCRKQEAPCQLSCPEPAISLFPPSPLTASHHPQLL